MADIKVGLLLAVLYLRAANKYSFMLAAHGWKKAATLFHSFMFAYVFYDCLTYDW